MLYYFIEKIDLMKIKLLCLCFVVFCFHACGSKKGIDKTIQLNEKTVKVYGDLPKFELTDQFDETFGLNDLLGK
ncbi:MAG: hypothetical protein CMO38_07345, partial [Verrucomicrobiaceae bacterium]|nr:hypothetical protein [Verrucomicrobiaceae bacterium]